MIFASLDEMLGVVVFMASTFEWFSWPQGFISWTWLWMGPLILTFFSLRESKAGVFVRLNPESL